MTPATARNHAICSAAYAVANACASEPVGGGGWIRRFIGENFSVVLSRAPGSPQGNGLLLDVFANGFGKVAAFRLSEDVATWTLVSLKAKTIEKWFPSLAAEATKAALMGTLSRERSRLH